MFTGIITDLGRVRAVERAGDARVEITTAYDTGEFDIGASIGCSGVCLTVVDKGPEWFAVNVSAATMSCTTLGAWREGTSVNLERSLRVGDELGGHIVIGHVDGVAEIVERRAEGDSIRFVFQVPEPLKLFIAPKGAVALDGVSLTVNRVEDSRFEVNLVPHTLRCTGFGAARPDDHVNLEVDVLARYVARMNQ